MDIKYLMVKLVPTVKGIELSCIKCCHKVDTGEFESMGDNDVSGSYLTLDDVVFKDCNCEKCGCNTFTIDTFVTVEVK